MVESKGLRGVRPRPIDREPVGVVRAAGFVRAVHDYHMTRSRRMHCESYANVGVFSVMPSQLCMRWSLDDRRARLSRDADAGGEPAARRPSGVSVCLSLCARVCVCVCVCGCTTTTCGCGMRVAETKRASTPTPAHGHDGHDGHGRGAVRLTNTAASGKRLP